LPFSLPIATNQSKKCHFFFSNTNFDFSTMKYYDFNFAIKSFIIAKESMTAQKNFIQSHLLAVIMNIHANYIIFNQNIMSH